MNQHAATHLVDSDELALLFLVSNTVLYDNTIRRFVYRKMKCVVNVSFRSNHYNDK